MTEDPEVRFRRKYVITDGPLETPCHVWLGYIETSGYGRYYTHNGKHRAHKWAYERINGHVPTGLELDHLCRNRKCVNPTHLEPVTHMENVRRGNAGLKKRSQTHCIHGHAFSMENTYMHPDGRRMCRACHRARVQQRRMLKRIT